MTSEDGLLQQGLALHRQGRLAEAKAVYESILKTAPRHFDALNMLGTVALQSGALDAAIALINRAIDVNPKVAAAHSNLGNAFLMLRRMDDALASYDRALALDPRQAGIHYNRGNALRELGRPADAVRSYDAALKLQKDYAEAHNNRGNALLALARPADALASYDKALALNPREANAHNNRGTALLALKRSRDALASYERALSLDPQQPEFAFNVGNALRDAERLDEALIAYDRAIALRPDYPDAHNNRGNVLLGMKRLDEALAGFDRALVFRPDAPDSHSNRGNVLFAMKRYGEALSSFDAAIALAPGRAEYAYNRGNALRELQRPDEALSSFDRAIALNPLDALTHSNRGNVLMALMRPADALAAFDKAIDLRPSFSDAFSNRGNALRELGRPAEAMASFDQAIALDPDNADAHYNRGFMLESLRRPDEAVASYERTLALKPDYEFLFGLLLHLKMKLCIWDGLADAVEDLRARVLAGKKATPTFSLFALIDDPHLHKQAAMTYTRAKFPRRDTLGPFAVPQRRERIRVGYYSADFRNHALMHLMVEMFESHDLARFEAFAFSYGGDVQDEMRQRVAATFGERFLDVTDCTDRTVAQMSREIGIDIAIDLNAYTKSGRPGLFAEGCAPIQVNYMVHPGTMGANYFDYIVADKVIIPPERQPDYTEQVIYMPHSYWVNDSQRKISDRVFTRTEFGLPEHGFVFCCFNNNHKILPDTFDIWMRLLKAVDGSVLWLLGDNATSVRNLRKEAATRGVDSNRLVFAERLPPNEHLARHRMADLFLDTLPYNAHTTASDALWAGLPVLTCAGQSFASRVAASLLTAVGLPELVTDTLEAYEAKALALARDQAQLEKIRRKLAANRLTSPLFNGKLFARHLEAAYTAVQERALAGLAPTMLRIAEK